MKSFVLLVDDETEIRNIIALTIEDSGIQCLAAENGLKALEILAKYPGQIATVVSDISMPNMNGLEFIERARQQGFDLPVIFITGFGDKNTMAQALRLGAFDFIDKPFDLDKLEKSIVAAYKAGEEIIKMYNELEESMKNSDPEQLKNLKDMRRHMLMMKLQSETKDKKVS